MVIWKSGLEWNGKLTPLDPAKIDGIALHHSAHPTAGTHEIHSWHLANGWAGFGYNYFIDKTGKVEEGRGLNVAAGVGGENGHLISVCFQGDFENSDKTMSKTQLEAGLNLIRWLYENVPSVKILDGHKAWNATACPGKFFPLEDFKTHFAALKTEINVTPTDNKPSGYAAAAIEKALEQGILLGTPDGDLMLKSPLTREDFFVFADRMGIL